MMSFVRPKRNPAYPSQDFLCRPESTLTIEYSSGHDGITIFVAEELQYSLISLQLLIICVCATSSSGFFLPMRVVSQLTPSPSSRTGLSKGVRDPEDSSEACSRGISYFSDSYAH